MKQFPNELELHQKYFAEICAKLEQDPFAKFLGIKLIEVGPGRAVAELTVAPHMLNAHGSTHGAVLFALADFVFAVACNSYGKTSVGLNTNVSFLGASFEGARLRATAEEEKRNNRTAWYRIKVESESEVLVSVDALAYRKNDYFVPVELNPSEN